MADWRKNPRAAPYIKAIEAAATKYGLDANLLGSLIQKESRFNPKARSHAGAIGIAQIIPKWHPDIDATDPLQSIDYAAKYLSSNIQRFDGDVNKGLAAYNAGPARTLGAIRNAERNGRHWLSLLRPETQDYVATLGIREQPRRPVIPTPRQTMRPPSGPALSPPNTEGTYLDPAVASNVLDVLRGQPQ